MNERKIRISRRAVPVAQDGRGGGRDGPATVVDVCQFPGGLPGTQNDYLALIDADVKAIVAALKAAK